MSTTEQYHVLNIPTTLLGLSYYTWTMTHMRLVLDHYDWAYSVTTPTKLDLMHDLHLLVQEYDLDKKDRKEIIDAHKGYMPLPGRKPRVRSVPRPFFPELGTIAPREDAVNQVQAEISSRAAVAATIDTDPQARNNVVLPTPMQNVTSALLRDCVVCFESLGPQNTPKRRITSACNHEPDICRNCLATSISTQFNSRIWDQIDCPTCGQRLEFQDVKIFADSVIFGRSETPCTPNQKKN